MQRGRRAAAGRRRRKSGRLAACCWNWRCWRSASARGIFIAFRANIGCLSCFLRSCTTHSSRGAAAQRKSIFAAAPALVPLLAIRLLAACYDLLYSVIELCRSFISRATPSHRHVHHFVRKNLSSGIFAAGTFGAAAAAAACCTASPLLLLHACCSGMHALFCCTRTPLRIRCWRCLLCPLGSSAYCW